MSSGPSPFRSWIASFTSREVPTVSPSGWFMSVTSATQRRFIERPTRVMERASCLACSRSLMKEPLPHLTSITRPSAPAASLRDRTLPVMSGRLGIVPGFLAQLVELGVGRRQVLVLGDDRAPDPAELGGELLVGQVALEAGDGS